MAVISAANAREMAAKSHAARRLRAAQADQRANTPPLTPQIADAFLAERLVRVRKQLDKLDSLIEEERDPNRLDRLASAQSRLSEQKRIMSGRPLPGSRRPARERTRPAPMGAVVPE